VTKLGDYVLEAVEKNDNLRKRSQEQMEELKQTRRTYIEKLVKYIFPISQLMVNPSPLYELQREKQESRKASSESLQMDTINEIAEAIRTAYVKGRWKQQESSGELQYIIVAPTLPSNGNYQEYCDWIIHNKDGTINTGMAGGNDSSSNVAHNGAYRIAAGLTYVAQLAQALSFYLDVRLPHKVSYSDFCTMGLNEKQFLKKVARLNMNVIYLCYNQNVQMKNVQPTHTMENVFQLLDERNTELGRTGAVSDTSERFVDSIMHSFTELFDDEEHSDTDDDEFDDSTHKDWENVANNIPILEIAQSAMTPQQSASMAGTIIHNVAHSLSFWRGWNK